ncbi:hypothetical protein [Modicisalibacter coralii]|uniref:hypothetical protein n=1 Tax=Modicisalibacter coralii TaxID=2304602 RepID=UPI00100BDB5F|nr:hypothetical protein [Halomonas coralii]
MKVWITSYSMTAGIREYDVPDDSVTDSGALFFRPSPDSFMDHVPAKHWHRDRESAIAAAEDMRQRKIKSVKKQLAKLEAMSF